MRTAQQTLDETFLEMRWRCLSLAADLDRIQRAPEGPAVLAADPRLQKLGQALAILLDGQDDRAPRVQRIFTDQTPPPKY